MDNKCYNFLCNFHINGECRKVELIKGYNCRDDCKERKAFNRILRSQYPKDEIFPEAFAIQKVGKKFLEEYGVNFPPEKQTAIMPEYIKNMRF